jgi:hypothetical protein
MFGSPVANPKSGPIIQCLSWYNIYISILHTPSDVFAYLQGKAYSRLKTTVLNDLQFLALLLKSEADQFLRFLCFGMWIFNPDVGFNTVRQYEIDEVYL